MAACVNTTTMSYLVGVDGDENNPAVSVDLVSVNESDGEVVQDGRLVEVRQ